MLILASASPRRREILGTLGVPFRVVSSSADEHLPAGLAPASAVKILARRKAEAVAAIYPEEPVLAADTIVAVDGLILGKPADDDDAARMLRLLSGRTHEVFTGVALRYRETVQTAVERTEVHVMELTDADIAQYIATGESADKAGAYAIQGIAARFVTGIVGDYSSVVGLPVHRTWTMLRSAGLLA